MFNFMRNEDNLNCEFASYGRKVVDTFFRVHKNYSSYKMLLKLESHNSIHQREIYDSRVWCGEFCLRLLDLFCMPGGLNEMSIYEWVFIGKFWLDLRSMTNSRGTQAKLQVFTHTALKEILFMEKDFLQEPENSVRQKVTKDFSLESAELDILEGRLADVLTVLKSKNPWLYLMVENAFKQN